MLRTTHIVIALLSIAFASQRCSADDKERLVRIWRERTAETAVTVAVDPAVPQYSKEYHVLKAAMALGAHGFVEEFNSLCDRASLEQDSSVRQNGLMLVATCLASRNDLEKAFSVIDVMKDGPIKSMAFWLVPIRRAQAGDFGAAETLLNRVPDETDRDKAIAQICEEFCHVRRFDDATRLCSTIRDNDLRSHTEDTIDKMRHRPTIGEATYIDFQLDQAREVTLQRVSEPTLTCLRHYYGAEIALSQNDEESFLRETNAARRFIEEGVEIGGCLPLLARLMHRASRKDDAKFLYLRLFDKFKEDDSSGPISFIKIWFGEGNPSDAEIVVDCMSDLELKLTVNELIDLDHATGVFSPIFGIVVSRRNPDWAEELYQRVTDIRKKADLASDCLRFLAIEPLPATGRLPGAITE